MSSIFIQNTASSITFYLSTLADAPATGILFGAVTARIQKEGATSFSSLPVTNLNWFDLGNGFYTLNLTSGNLDTVGNVYVSITTSTTTPALLVGYVTTVVTPPTPPSPTVPSSSAISGFILDIQGAPVKNASVTFRLLGSPVSVSGSGYSSGPIVTKTDASGYFNVSLIQGMSVDVRIPAINYSRTFVVPNTDASLFEIV